MEERRGRGWGYWLSLAGQNWCCRRRRRRHTYGCVTKKFQIRPSTSGGWLVARVFPDKSRGEIRDFKMQLFRARARHKRRHYMRATCVCVLGVCNMPARTCDTGEASRRARRVTAAGEEGGGRERLYYSSYLADSMRRIPHKRTGCSADKWISAGDFVRRLWAFKTNFLARVEVWSAPGKWHGNLIVNSKIPEALCAHLGKSEKNFRTIRAINLFSRGCRQYDIEAGSRVTPILKAKTGTQWRQVTLQWRVSDVCNVVYY